MSDVAVEVLRLVRATPGHYRFESGYHGDTWLDLEALFQRPDAVKGMVQELARRLSMHDISAVCGPLTGGAFTALLVAGELDVAFFYSEQVAGRPGDALLSVRYRVPGSLRERVKGQRVAIVNDVTSAGSAVRGTFADLEVCQAQVVAIGSLLVLGSAIDSYASDKSVALEALAFAEQNLWDPKACPLCESGVPLVTPSYGPTVGYERSAQ